MKTVRVRIDVRGRPWCSQSYIYPKMFLKLNEKLHKEYGNDVKLKTGGRGRIDIELKTRDKKEMDAVKKDFDRFLLRMVDDVKESGAREIPKRVLNLLGGVTVFKAADLVIGTRIRYLRGRDDEKKE